MVGLKEEHSGYDMLVRRRGGSDITMLVLKAQNGTKADEDEE